MGVLRTAADRSDGLELQTAAGAVVSFDDDLLSAERGSHFRPFRQRQIRLCRDSVGSSLTALSGCPCRKASQDVAVRRPHHRRVRMCPRVQRTDNSNVPICRHFIEALWRTRTADPLLTMEVPERYGRTRPGTRDHVSPANRPVVACRPCPRVPARAQAGVPVSYPRGVDSLEN
jgi:hypothetical protein